MSHRFTLLKCCAHNFVFKMSLQTCTTHPFVCVCVCVRACVCVCVGHTLSVPGTQKGCGLGVETYLTQPFLQCRYNQGAATAKCMYTAELCGVCLTHWVGSYHRSAHVELS
jgi:hypothetical protein